MYNFKLSSSNLIITRSVSHDFGEKKIFMLNPLTTRSRFVLIDLIAVASSSEKNPKGTRSVKETTEN